MSQISYDPNGHLWLRDQKLNDKPLEFIDNIGNITDPGLRMLINKFIPQLSKRWKLGFNKKNQKG